MEEETGVDGPMNIWREVAEIGVLGRLPTFLQLLHEPELDVRDATPVS